RFTRERRLWYARGCPRCRKDSVSHAICWVRGLRYRVHWLYGPGEKACSVFLSGNGSGCPTAFLGHNFEVLLAGRTGCATREFLYRAARRKSPGWPAGVYPVRENVVGRHTTRRNIV